MSKIVAYRKTFCTGWERKLFYSGEVNKNREKNNSAEDCSC